MAGRLRKDVQLAFAILMALTISIAPFALAGRLWAAIPGLAVFAMVVAATSSLSAGWRVSAAAIAVFAVLGAVAVAVHTQPLASATLIALAAGVCAYLSRWGLAYAVLLAPVFVPYLIHEPPVALNGSTASFAYYAAIVATLLVAGAWGVGLMAALRKWRSIPLPPRQPVPQLDALLAAILIAINAGVVAYVAITWFSDTMWVWLLLTLFILTKPTVGLNLVRVRDRTVGTLIGALAGALILLANPPVLVAVIIGIVSLTIALTFMLSSRPYWMYATALTPAIILFDTQGQDGVELADQRLSYTLIGAVLAVGLSALINYLVRMRRHWAASRS